MKENFKNKKNMGMVYLHILMEINMKDNGKIIKNMDRYFKLLFNS